MFLNFSNNSRLVWNADCFFVFYPYFLEYVLPPRSFFILDTRKKKKDAKIVCLDIPRLLVSETRSVKGVGARISGKKK